MSNNLNEKFLVAMLSGTCPTMRSKDSPVSLFIYDMHCNNIWVAAKVGADPINETYVYEVLWFKLQNNRTFAEMFDQAKQYGKFED